MDLIIEGMTEEEYSLWLNRGDSLSILNIQMEHRSMTHIGFDMERVKNFKFDLSQFKHVIFVKVDSDKNYDFYREHLITVIKMLIISGVNYQVYIVIVSSKYEEYQKELSGFFNLSTRYNRQGNLGQWGAVIKVICMSYVGFSITDKFIKLITLISKK